MTILAARGRPTKKSRIFELMAKGLDNEQIAERLNVSRGCVANWRIVWSRSQQEPQRA